MKQIKLTTGEYLLVEVPEDTVAWEMYDKESVPLAVLVFRNDPNGLFKPGIPEPIYPIPPGQWEIIGKASEFREEQWGKIVEMKWEDLTTMTLLTMSYSNNQFEYDLSPTESGLSLIKSHSMNPSTTLVIRKIK